MSSKPKPPNSHAKLRVEASSSTHKFEPKYQSVTIAYYKEIKLSPEPGPKYEIKEELVKALVDDQASCNFISRRLVEEADLQHEVLTGFEIKLCDGNTCEALCRVPLPYKLSNELVKKHTNLPSRRNGVQDFHVLPRAIADVVLGIPFLGATRLSMESLGPELEPIPDRTWISMIASLKNGAQPTTKATTMPNRGAGSNMMSAEHADRYQMDDKRKSTFVLGNGRKISAKGEVKGTKIGFPKDHKDPHRKLSKIAVIEGLPAALVLSNSFLEDHDISGNKLAPEPAGVSGLYASRLVDGQVNSDEEEKFHMYEEKDETAAVRRALEWLFVDRGPRRLNSDSERGNNAVEQQPAAAGATTNEDASARNATTNKLSALHRAATNMLGNGRSPFVQQAHGTRLDGEHEMPLMSGGLGQSRAKAEPSMTTQNPPENEADIEARDKDGRTALHLAVLQRGEIEHRIEFLVSEVLRKHADVKAKDLEGNTALHLAALMGNPDVTRLLLEKNAEVEAKDPKGNTALHLAALMGHPDVVRVLLEKNAEVEAKNLSGKTAIDFAEEGQRIEVIRLLKENKNRQATDTKGTAAR